MADDMYGKLDPGQCPSCKAGEYNPLRCAREAGHEGAHSYYVSGNYPQMKSTSKRKASVPSAAASDKP